MFWNRPESTTPQAVDEWFTPSRFAVLLALFILAMFPDVILGGRTFIFRDFGIFGYPLADFLSVSQVTSATNLLEWTARPTALPMATAGQRPIFLDSTNTLAALTSPSFNPRSKVFLRAEDKEHVSVTGRSAARIISTNWSPHRITLVMEANEPALVVISQSFYHNWRAYVGGRSTPLLHANYAFQALQIPAGRHQVTLVYEDRAFYCGAVIFLVAVAACVAIWLRARKRSLS